MKGQFKSLIGILYFNLSRDNRVIIDAPDCKFERQKFPFKARLEYNTEKRVWETKAIWGQPTLKVGNERAKDGVCNTLPELWTDYIARHPSIKYTSARNQKFEKVNNLIANLQEDIKRMEAIASVARTTISHLQEILKTI